MSGPGKLSTFSEAHPISQLTENDLDGSIQVSTKVKIGSNEVLAQPERGESIPQSQRRGLLASITIVSEIENALLYSNGKKWLFTAIVALAGTISSTGSSILYPALHPLAKDFGVSPSVANLLLAFYELSMAITPLWWSEYSEAFGRRSIYIVSFAFFVVFSAIAAVSVNMGMFIAFRLLIGGAAGSVQSVGFGTIADIWEPKERGKALGVFMLGPLCGPGLAPIIGGALTQAFGWRSIQWFLTIFGGLVLALILFCLPETVRLNEARSNVQGPNSKSAVERFLLQFVKPVRILGLLRHPAIFVVVYSAGISFGVMYVGYVELQATFTFAPYNFDETTLGLLYLAPTIGYAIASVLGGRWLDYIMKREATKAGRVGDDGETKYLPEDRMKENMWVGAVLYPACLIWFGWAIDKGLHWAVAAVSLVLFGIFGMTLYGAIATALTEFTPKRSSSGIALNNFVRNILAFIAAVVTQPLVNAMGVGWTTTMVSLFSLATILPAIAILQNRSAKWREAMDKNLNG